MALWAINTAKRKRMEHLLLNMKPIMGEYAKLCKAHGVNPEHWMLLDEDENTITILNKHRHGRKVIRKDGSGVHGDYDR